jgi:uncharacterized protein YjbI with pentapeptide repeats
LNRILADHKLWLQENDKGARAVLPKASFRLANLPFLNLPKADLTKSDFSLSTIGSVDFEGATLFRANFWKADLSPVSSDPEFFRPANLSSSVLRESFLVEANLRLADLKDADLSGAQLRAANLEKADLRGANLQGTDLSDVVLRDANMSGADLASARLSGTDLTGVNASFARFSKTWFEPSAVTGLKLGGAKDLSSLRFLDNTILSRIRDNLRGSGYRREERMLTSALRKGALESSSPLEKFAEHFAFGGWITDVGANPWRALAALAGVVRGPSAAAARFGATRTPNPTGRRDMAMGVLLQHPICLQHRMEGTQCWHVDCPNPAERVRVASYRLDTRGLRNPVANKRLPRCALGDNLFW